MRILYLSQYFPPEAGATQTRAYEMARNLVRLGHAVTLIAEVPNHPSGVIPREYRGKLYECADLEGIRVIRVWVKTSPIKNFRNRMLFYLSYMINSILAGLFLARERFDLVFATSPPLFVGAAGVILSYLKRLPFVFEVRDLWPESAVALGELNNRLAIRLATRLEEKCYQRASKVVVVTQGIHEHLQKRGIPSEKLAVIPNGANLELFHFDLTARDRIRQELGLEGKFVAIYAGIHGVAQGLEIVIEVARRLETDPTIHFLMIGDGPKKRELLELANRYQLRNLTMLPEQPRDAIPAYLSAADIALIPLRNLDVFKTALPSKLFDAWACQRPVLLSVDGEARRIVEEAGGGVYVPPEDLQAFQAALLWLKNQPLERERMGIQGRAYTDRYYSRSALAQKLADLLTASLN